MAGRYTITKFIDGCLSPITVFHYGKKYLVPCGKCSACLVNRSNDWNWRLSDEIDAFRYPIFFTLTYNNYYVPKVHLVHSNGLYFLESDEKNVRFDGVKDVPRDDDFSDLPYVSSRCWPLIQNYHSDDYFCYSSKRDFQLYLKLLRKSIDDNLVSNCIISKDDSKIRYYAISEYGPSTYRCHIHGIFFTNNQTCAEYLVNHALYSCWQMCDKALFDEYTHYADSGAAGYLSSYLTCFTSLPQILRASKCFKPFRLSSKSPAVGFSAFNKTEVFENVSIGVIEYSKRISRIDASYVFRYSPKYLATLFPKCYEYSILSYPRLLQVYGRIYSAVVTKGRELVGVLERFRQNLRPIDYQCALKCYYFCTDNEVTPDYYLTLLDNVLYASSMFALKQYYEWQSTASSVEVLLSYINVLDYRARYYTLSYRSRRTFEYFLDGFGIDVMDFLDDDVYDITSTTSDLRERYSAELNDVLVDMVKTKKLNEQLKTSPSFNF